VSGLGGLLDWIWGVTHGLGMSVGLAMLCWFGTQGILARLTIAGLARARPAWRANKAVDIFIVVAVNQDKVGLRAQRCHEWSGLGVGCKGVRQFLSSLMPFPTKRNSVLRPPDS